MRTRLLIDAKNLCWRAQSAMGELADSEGNLTGAIHGFLLTLLRVRAEYAPSARVVICWDDWDGGPAKRREIYSAYKKKDEPPDLERIEVAQQVWKQQEGLMEFLSQMNVSQCRSVGWEADDVMGTLAKRHSSKGEKVFIFSGDRDLLQCVSENVTVLRPGFKGEVSVETPATVLEKFGVPVERFVDYKALVGDPGDNIPGCKGIGPKGAAVILESERGVQEAVYRAEVDPEWKYSKFLLKGGDEALLSHRLAAIMQDVPLVWISRQLNLVEARKFLAKRKLTTLLMKWQELKRLGGGLK